jgi:hypothetical protein
MPDSARMQQALNQPLLHGKVIRLGLMIAPGRSLLRALWCHGAFHLEEDQYRRSFRAHRRGLFARNNARGGTLKREIRALRRSPFAEAGVVTFTTLRQHITDEFRMKDPTVAVEASSNIDVHIIGAEIHLIYSSPRLCSKNIPDAQSQART